MLTKAIASSCCQKICGLLLGSFALIGMVFGDSLVGQEKKSGPEDGLKNVTVYSPRSTPLTYDELAKLAEQCSAELELVKGEKDDWQKVNLKWEGKSLQIFRDDGDGLNEHLRGFTGYVFSQLANESMDALVFATMRQIRRTRHVYGCLGEPALHDTSMQLVSKLANQHNALLFLDDSVWSPELKVILGTNDRRDEEAKLPAFDSATERRDQTNKILKAAKVPTNPNLPLIVTDEEVQFRDAQQVARRALCLFAVARHASDAEEFDAIGFLKDLDAWSEISGEEKAFLENDEPKKETRNSLTWRYESCQALLWCLDQRTIDFPNEMISIQALTEVVIENADSLVEKARLRPTKEILDHTDLVYRCLWAGRQARGSGKEIPEMNLSVVYERVYALNWITQLLNADWDFVPTDS